MGALVFKPVIDGRNFNDGLLVDLAALVESARQAMKGEAAGVLAQLVQSGLSPGGARPKALLWLSPDGREVHLDEGGGREPWQAK